MRIKYTDLEEVGMLGCGGFGKVTLVEHKDTKDMFALKALNKGYCMMKKMEKTVLEEKKIQMMCESPFIVQLFETYNGPQELFLLLELSIGGDVCVAYEKGDLWGSEKHTQFYSACCVFGLQYLHERSILWRDLKPENMLVTKLGWVKLTDFGISKVSAGKTFTNIGTPNYMAPEVIEGVGHNFAVDWWSLGIATFELLSGFPPFDCEDNPKRILKRAQAGLEKVDFQKRAGQKKFKAIGSEAEHYIKALARRDPMERIGIRKGGVENIKKHPWWKNAAFDWDAAEVMDLEPPYIPEIKSREDLANKKFSPDDLPPQLNFKDYDDGSGWDNGFATSD